MRLKSFFANTIEEAIRLARHELGPDAMLVNSKRTSAEAQHLGFYEVVVCGEGPEAGLNGGQEDESTASRTVAPLPPRNKLSEDKLSQDISELKRRMEKIALTLARSGSGMASVAFDPERSRAFTALTDAELDTELAYDVVGKLTPPIVENALRSELARLVRIDAELGSRGSPVRVVAMVGPPGSGKTSALVKLAVQYGISARKRVQILTTDTYRIAAAEELRSYAAILGIGCQVVESAAALAAALEEFRQKDLILIDTPGLSRFEMDACEDLANTLATHRPVIDTHLVLPASMRAADLYRAAERYTIFRPRKLLFTRLDETETFGPLLSLSVRMGLPISFYSPGQRIPEDLQPATGDLLLDQILRAPHAAQSKFDVVAA